MACDPQTLIAGATCLECNVPPGMQLPVLIALAAQIAGVSADPQSLVASAAPLQAIPDGLRLPVLISLACQIAKV